MISKEKIELKLLAGIPIEVEGICKVHTPKLYEIASIGEENYHFYLHLCTSEPSKFLDKNSLLYNEYKNLSTYEFLLLYSTFSYLNGNEAEVNILTDSMSFFLKEKVCFSLNEDGEPFFYLEESGQKITNDIYEQIKQIIMIQNGLEIKDNEDKEFNPKNKKAQEIADKIKKAREKIKKIKNKMNKDDNITLADLISIFSSYYKSKINILDVWKLDIYQFNDQFQRMKINEEYEISIQSLLHGADPNEVKVKNFLTKIK